MQTHSNFSLSQPIPLEANGHIAEHVQVILAGFAEFSKSSVLHMSSLFQGFILCQLWTMYCENISAQNPPGSEQYQQCTLTLSDFWAKITPGILQLVCHSKVVSYPLSLSLPLSLYLSLSLLFVIELDETSSVRYPGTFNCFHSQTHTHTHALLNEIIAAIFPLILLLQIIF